MRWIVTYFLFCFLVLGPQAHAFFCPSIKVEASTKQSHHCNEVKNNSQTSSQPESKKTADCCSVMDCLVMSKGEKIYAPASAKRISQKLEYLYRSQVIFGNFFYYGLQHKPLSQEDTALTHSYSSSQNAKKHILRL